MVKKVTRHSGSVALETVAAAGAKTARVSVPASGPQLACRAAEPPVFISYLV